MKEYFLYPICKFLEICLPMRTGIPVLIYHSISRSDSYLAVSPEKFEKQIDYLKRSGYRTLRPVELLGLKNSEKKVIISFDDGFKDNFTTALPILKKYGFTAAIFISTKYINKRSKYCSDNKDKNFQMLSSEEIWKLETAGWQICSHFHSHRNLIDLGEQEIRDEFKTSKEILNQIVINKQSLDIVSYPRNKINENVLSVVASMGIQIGFVGGNIIYDKEKDEIFTVPRIEVYNDINLTKFKLYLSSVFNKIKRVNNRIKKLK